MTIETGQNMGPVAQVQSRRSGSDRRDDRERRRSALGLLEARARQGGIGDRRRKSRRIEDDLEDFANSSGSIKWFNPRWLWRLRYGLTSSSIKS